MEKARSPGPGAYDKIEGISRRNNAGKIGTAQRSTFVSNNKSISEMPGPGNYTERDYFEANKNKGAIIQGKKARKDDNGIPGPGSYYDE